MIRRAQEPLGSDAPTVSVVVPCYNYGHFLPANVSSILGQSGVQVEVIIIDDASADGSADVARRLADSDSRVHAIVHRVNQGHIATYNEGLATATGEFLVLLSADDLLVRGSLQRAVTLMTSYPSVGLVYGHPRTFADVVPAPRTAVRSWSVWRGSDWIRRQCRRGMSIIYSPEAVVRASVQRAVGDYRAELPHTADLEMWLRIASVSDVGRVNGPDQAFRREHPRSMMHTSYSSVLTDLDERRRAFASFFSETHLSSQRIRGLELSSSRSMATEALDWVNSNRSLPAEQAMAAAEFANATYDRTPDLAAWNEFRIQRRSSQWPTVLEPVPLFAHRVRRSVRGRVRARRWYWLGT
jgi:hypothetical protein